MISWIGFGDLTGIITIGFIGRWKGSREDKENSNRVDQRRKRKKKKRKRTATGEEEGSFDFAHARAYSEKRRNRGQLIISVARFADADAERILETAWRIRSRAWRRTAFTAYNSGENRVQYTITFVYTVGRKYTIFG